VHGGQNPISGAHVHLLAVNNTGYGGPGVPASSTDASVSLLTSGAGQDGLGYYVTTDVNGDFTLTGDYTCPSAYANTYIYAVGGDSGSGSNSAITLVAGGDVCDSSAFIVVNEVSTVAAVYSYAGFISDPTHVSTSNTALAATALQNAGAAYSNLLNASSLALATTPAGNGTVPQSEINTLANILAACVNSTGPASTQCSTLFSNATNNGVDAPDTATAAVNIAHNPGPSSTIVGNLFGLQTATSPFQPMLSTAPNDFTIAISYTGGGLNALYDIAIDAEGNVWVANQNGNSISEFNPAGAALSGSSGFGSGHLSGPYALAIDSSSNVWVTNNGTTGLSEFNSFGTVNSNSPFSGGGISSPLGIAFDSQGNIWTNNTGASTLSKLNSSGSPVSGSAGYTGGGLDSPQGMAIDISGHIWTANYGGGGTTISEFGSGGSPISGSEGDSGGGLNLPVGIALDGAGNLWVANNNGNSLSEFNSSGTAVSSDTGYTGGGLNLPFRVAVDGANNVWVTNLEGESISKFNSSGTPITGSSGYKANGLLGPFAIAIDGSGNLWTGGEYGTTLYEFVGAASPVVTPIVANLLAPYGSHAVNLP
jgi:streptogramin lyase